MKLTRTDYFLAVASKQFADVFKVLGDIETRLLRTQLAEIRNDGPVFVTGLARSGTTIILSVLEKLPGLSSHKYRDFPFVFLPYFWSRFQDRFAASRQATERPHKDGIQITSDSPDAFEETIWQYFFPYLHDKQAVHVLDENVNAPDFEKFYQEHILKILLLRSGSRYLSKGNYNITRILYLAKLFPDARFVIPVRHPYDHVESLVNQHRLFSGYAATDKRIGRYLEAAGHYEFGPQRIPISLTTDTTHRIEEAWSTGHEHRGYAIQWQAIYGHAKALCDNPSLEKQIMILRFEDLCSQPVSSLQGVFDFLDIDINSAQTAKLACIIRRPSDKGIKQQVEHRKTIWEETEVVARDYGYQGS